MGDTVAGRRRRGVSFGPAKAREMLESPPHGKALSPGQRNLFEMVSHGEIPTRLKSRRRKRR